MKTSEKVLDRLAPLLAFDNAPLGLLIDTRYEVKERLARGGMGEVFSAWDTRLGRAVAMKILAPGLSDPEWGARFRMEAQTLTRLDHPGIVPIYDFGVLPDGRLYYTMKFVPGRTLAERIEGGETRDSLVGFLADACDTVQHAHDQNILHRDLKPANIIVDEHGRVFVLDWGIARLLEEFAGGRRGAATGAPGLTSTGTVLGTPEYMPPERASGDAETTDNRSDVFSLGAVLHEVLTGHPPVSPRPAAVPIAASVPPDIEAVCLRALAAEPAFRYPSARALGDDLRRFLRGEPVEARPLPGIERLKRGVRRHRTTVLLLAGAAACVLVAGGWGIRAATRKSDAIRATLEDAARSERQAKVEEALGLLERGRPAIDRAHHYLYGREARYEELVRQVEEGRPLLQRAVELAPTLPLGHYLLGRAWELKGEWGEAESCWRKAIALDPNFGPARYQLGRLLATRSFFANISPVGDPAANAVEAARLASESVAHIEAAVREGSGFHDAVQREVASALLACARGDADSFAAIVAAGIRKFPSADGVEDLYWLSGFALQPRERRAALDRAVEIRPKHFCALVTRAAFRARADELEAAVTDYGEALRINPRLPRIHVFRGDVRFRLGDFDGALADFEEALRLDPRDARSYVCRGNVRCAKGDPGGELADAETALGIDPRCAEAHVARGCARLRQGDAAGAVGDFDRAISFRPGFADAYLNRGIARRKTGDGEGAMKDYDEAIRLKPEYPRAFSVRGAARYARGDTAGALRDYDEAIRLNPRFAEAHADRAAVRRKMGDVKGAIEDLEQALRLAPPGWPHRRAVEDRLRALKRGLEER
ncbi:MAG: tetratricopeptide repeat protein [Planctomycetes bacterium]|nr:tetratricopeptide repeat protein [Planctomycetota bacterium]